MAPVFALADLPSLDMLTCRNDPKTMYPSGLWERRVVPGDHVHDGRSIDRVQRVDCGHEAEASPTHESQDDFHTVPCVRDPPARMRLIAALHLGLPRTDGPKMHHAPGAMNGLLPFVMWRSRKTLVLRSKNSSQRKTHAERVHDRCETNSGGPIWQNPSNAAPGVV